MRSIAVFITLLASAVSVFASGIYDGIYQLGSTQTYWTVQQNGNNMIAAEFTTLPSTGISLTTTSGVTVRPNVLDVWELHSGPISGTTAQLTGNSIYGACSQVITAVFDAFGNVRSTISSLTNTTLGTAQGINCNAILLQIQSTTGLTRTLTKVSF